MPVAPTYGSQRVGPAGVPQVRETPYHTPAEFGAAVGEGIQKAAGFAADVYVNQSVTRAQDAANGATAKLQAWAAQNTQVSGFAANGLSNKASAEFDKIDSEIRNSLGGNEYALGVWEKQSASMRNSFLAPIQRHEYEQMNSATRITKNQNLLNVQNDAAVVVADPKAFVTALETVRSTAKDLAAFQGASPETSDMIAQNAVRGAYSKSIELAIDAKDFNTASDRFDKFKDLIPAEDRAKFEGALYTHKKSQMTADVAMMAADAVIPKEPKMPAPGASQEYIAAYATWINSKIDRDAGLRMIYSSPLEDKAGAAARFNALCDADEAQRKNVVNASLDAFSRMVDGGASLVETAKLNPQQWNMFNVEQRETLRNIEDRRLEARPANPAEKSRLWSLPPEKAVLVPPTELASAGFSRKEIEEYGKYQQKIGTGEAALQHAKRQNDVIEMVINQLAVAKGTTVKDMDKNKRAAVESIVRNTMAEFEAKPGGAWADPGQYMPVATKVWDQELSAAEVEAQFGYHRGNSNAAALNLTDAGTKTFDTSIEALLGWAPQAHTVAISTGGLTNQEPYTLAFGTLTGMARPEQEKARAEMQVLHPDWTPVQVDQEIIRTYANKRKSEYRSFIGRAMDYQTTVTTNLLSPLWSAAKSSAQVLAEITSTIEGSNQQKRWSWDTTANR